MNGSSDLSHRILIAEDFSKFPGGRFKVDGDWSGEQFREEYLVPILRVAIAENSQLTIVLDGTVGYATSFLEEAFGGLVREGRFSKVAIQSHLKIEAGPLFERYKLIVMKCIREAVPKVAS